MKRKKGLKKESKQKISVLQRKLWALLRLKVFELYGTDCYTCEAKNLQGSNRQCGHMWPKAALGAWLKYDTRVLRPQCFHCNINLGGNGAVFYARMLKEIGEDNIKVLEKEKLKSVQAYPHYLEIYQSLTFSGDSDVT